MTSLRERLKIMFEKFKELVCKHSWAIDFYSVEHVYGKKVYEQFCVKCQKRHPTRVQRDY